MIDQLVDLLKENEGLPYRELAFKIMKMVLRWRVEDLKV